MANALLQRLKGYAVQSGVNVFATTVKQAAKIILVVVVALGNAFSNRRDTVVPRLWANKRASHWVALTAFDAEA